MEENCICWKPLPAREGLKGWERNLGGVEYTIVSPDGHSSTSTCVCSALSSDGHVEACPG